MSPEVGLWRKPEWRHQSAVGMETRTTRQASFKTQNRNLEWDEFLPRVPGSSLTLVLDLLSLGLVQQCDRNQPEPTAVLPLPPELTCPGRRTSSAPPPAPWRRCRRRCASARSPWSARPSCRWWRRGRRGRRSRAGRSARRRTRWSDPRWSSPGRPGKMVGMATSQYL